MVTLNALLVTPVMLSAVARSVYPLPIWSILRSENVATPFDAVTTVVPDSRALWSKLPSCASAMVTGRVKLCTVFPGSSTTATCTGGAIVMPGSSVLLGCTRNARWVVCGLSATTLANQVLGDWNDQVHCGSTEPAAFATVYSPSNFTTASHVAVIGEKPGASARSTTAFAIVTPYASAPASRGIAPGSAIVVVEPIPVAEWCAASAAANATPLYAEISSPPSVIWSEKIACTARILSWLGAGSGKFFTLVATYVAIDQPLAVTYSTSVYVLATGVSSSRWSLTLVIVLVEPRQKKVATMASPRWGFWSNALPTWVPPLPDGMPMFCAASN